MIRLWWKKVHDYMHAHHVAFHRAHHATHLAYFGMVATHGAYHYAALALLIMGIAFWLCKIEE